MILTLLKLLKKELEIILSNAFYEAGITLLPRLIQKQSKRNLQVIIFDEPV
jgi:hypothetical protein